jgi:hypothetical protein
MYDIVDNDVILLRLCRRVRKPCDTQMTGYEYLTTNP